MNWNRMAGDWKQVKSKVREQWGLLSDERLDRIAGKRDRLVGNIQESYGIAREDAERQVMAWEMRNAFLATGPARSSPAQASAGHRSDR
jgi:uncharacterized protein YjbJ (UPF0337 family)